MLDEIDPIKDPTRSVAAGARSLAELFLRRAAASPNAIAWKSKKAGVWAPATWGEVHLQAARVATFLGRRGLLPGDKIAMVGSTRAEWCIGDIAGQLAALVTVGAYPTLAAGQLAYLLDHADVRVAFVEGPAEVEKIIEIKRDCPKLERVVVWDWDKLTDEQRAHAWIVSFADVLATEPDHALVAERARAIDWSATAILVYTSGTTGPPKGAMISHENAISLLASIDAYFDRSDTSLSFLPMAHVAERLFSFWNRISHGIASAFASSVPAVLEEMREVRPTIFGSVPRIFEKAYARITGEIAKAPPARQRVFRWAEGVARRIVADWQAGRPSPRALVLQHRIADRLVFARIRAAFGGRVTRFATGAAPTPRHILEFFWGAGLPIYEVYGMTEATVVSHYNRPGAVRLGSVGRPLPCFEDRIAEDGEILLRGKPVFKGYYKDPEATREVLDDEGWLHTGDIGKKDEDGYLYIVDRKKHLIITAGGKNISPANLENEIKAADPIISQVHAHGDRRPYCTALVTIQPLEAIEWAKNKGLAPDPDALEGMRRALVESPLARPPGLDAIMAKVTADPEIRRRIVEAVRRANDKLSRVETIKRVALLERDFSLEEDEITPTLKVKRKTIEKKFTGLFDRLYEDETFGIRVEER
ncbi:AMP-dependent synthetase/ligase [Polyangium aurulentum]|uniref:AMP-dependent synthetase/ligase n=1 Tax=Polyangium aurulentum TaxID=2567896 RepID=UPI00146DAC38|nr:long-chain fatty acid--CoA ligase [Polyangium aurulentum]UQA56737.1 long-chain fatty acid--CoA ligase [Polyangium aurulentum]